MTSDSVLYFDLASMTELRRFGEQQFNTNFRTLTPDGLEVIRHEIASGQDWLGRLGTVSMVLSPTGTEQ